ncbi:hypothetical protein [Fictibacillus phosphorivorans]|uniref:hypothetical protein n=1 Tax=Fictibacillus phosphorivorans TaxID=1221500 RepID=UPI003CD0E0C1
MLLFLVKLLFSFLILIIGFVPLKRRVQILLNVAFIMYTLVISWHLFINIWV